MACPGESSTHDASENIGRYDQQSKSVIQSWSFRLGSKRLFALSYMMCMQFAYIWPTVHYPNHHNAIYIRVIEPFRRFTINMKKLILYDLLKIFRNGTSEGPINSSNLPLDNIKFYEAGTANFFNFLKECFHRSIE